jgi:hypothetical protein
MTVGTPRSLETHPWWKHFWQALEIEAGTLLATGHKHRRIELRTALFTMEQIAKLLDLRIACAACQAAIRPFRKRAGKSAGRADRPPSRLYVGLTCQLSENTACARGAAATRAYESLIRALQSPPDSTPAGVPGSIPARPPSEERQLGLRGVP